MEERSVKETGMEQVSHPQLHFTRIKRLCKKVQSPRCEGLPPGILAYIRGQNQHGQVFVVTQTRVDLLHDIESVKVGHVQIEENKIRVVRLDQRFGAARV